jgi:hypothetical protein
MTREHEPQPVPKLKVIVAPLSDRELDEALDDLDFCAVSLRAMLNSARNGEDLEEEFETALYRRLGWVSDSLVAIAQQYGLPY